METNRYQFSKREKDVISLLMQGKSNLQIALELGISSRTVEFHLGSIYTKLKVTSRAEAILKLAKSYLWESAGQGVYGQQGESLVENVDKTIDNDDDKKPFSLRRILMKEKTGSKRLNVLLIIATAILLISFLIFIQTTPRLNIPATLPPTQTPWVITAAPTRVVKPASTYTSTPNSEKIYFSTGDTLYKMNLDGTNLEVITQKLFIDEISVGENFSLDQINNKLYISQWDSHGQITVVNLMTNSITYIDGPGIGGGQGLAVDPYDLKIYEGLYYNGVYVLDMNNMGEWKQLVDSASLYPLHGQRGQLQIDITNRHIYFRTAYNFDCDRCRTIYRVDFDGRNLIKILPFNSGDALALDLTEHKMYFSDGFDSSSGNGSFAIHRANLNGSEEEIVLNLPNQFPYCRQIALDLVHKKIYLNLRDDINYHSTAIARVNMDGTDFEILYKTYRDTEAEAAGGLAVYLP